MGLKAGREIYSGYHPAWIFSHALPYWIKALNDAGFLPSIEDVVKEMQTSTVFHFMRDEYVNNILTEVVPQAMEKFGMNEIIAVAKLYPCFEDFDDRPSRQKTDFKNKYYHKKTKHPMVSLEEFKEKYKKTHDNAEWDQIDETIDIERDITAEINVADFLETLSENDKQILELRMKGLTYKEIAEKVGYKTHSAVLKRIKAIGKDFEKFTHTDLGFE